MFDKKDKKSPGLEVMIFSDLGLGKSAICFKMSKVRLFKDLKKYSNQVFFYESLWSKFSFFSLAVIFSKFLEGIKEKAPKHQTR